MILELFTIWDNCYYEKIGDEVKNIDDEIPFDIPESWIWARLKTISNYGETIQVDKDQIDDDSWVLDLEDIKSYSSKLIEKKRRIDKTISSKKNKFQKNDLLFSKLRVYLKKVIIADEDGYCSSEIIPIKLSYCSPEFAQLFFISDYFVKTVELLQYGIKMPRLGTKDGQNFLFPLPPINEQELIVKRINDLDLLMSSIFKSTRELHKLVDNAKQKILEQIFGEDSSYKSYYKNYVSISDLFNTISTVGKEIKTKDILKEGKYPVVSQSKNLIEGYCDDEKKLIYDIPVIVFGDHTRNIKFIDFQFVPGADGTKVIKPKAESKFLYYCCLYASNHIEDRGYNRHFSLFKKTLVPNIENIEEQKAIANKLDTMFIFLGRILD